MAYLKTKMPCIKWCIRTKLRIALGEVIIDINRKYYVKHRYLFENLEILSCLALKEQR